MKRDDWYKSAKFKKLRLFGNVASEVQMKCQYLYDILEIILEDQPELMSFDKFTIVERQLRVLQLETGKLVDKANDLILKLKPHEEQT